MTHAANLRYWRRVRALTLGLLLLWFLASFVVIFFARELSSVSLWGWPLHFYLAAQGVTLVYLAITGVYALAMQRIDRLARLDQREGGDEG
jgi:putative solute:sodium symporter small subunit